MPKISAEPAATVMANGDIVLGNQGGTTKTFTRTLLYTAAAGEAITLVGNSSSSIAIAIDGSVTVTPAAGKSATLTAGNLLFTDNTQDIGVAGATRPRNIFVGGAVCNRVKAGTPVDGDLTNPTDGMLVVDTSALKIWVRVGGAWKGVVVS